MTRVAIVTTITTINSGTVELGHFDLSKLSVGEVKRRVEQQANVPASTQKLWWRGYILDEDMLPLTRACVGVFFFSSDFVVEVFTYVRCNSTHIFLSTVVRFIFLQVSTRVKLWIVTWIPWYYS